MHPTATDISEAMARNRGGGVKYVLVHLDKQSRHLQMQHSGLNTISQYNK